MKKTKSEKAKARRKNFLRKKNINSNKPVPKFNMEKPIMKAERDPRTNRLTGEYKIAGSKTIIRKGSRKSLAAGDGILPKSRKWKAPKKK